MRERTKGRRQEQAALKANLKSRKTVAKYERLGQLPGELKQPRPYRTRADPFSQDWPEVERMLAVSPELEAKSLFEWLCEQQPGKYQEGQRRSLQRRLADWRVLNQDKVAVLSQIHRPGEVLPTDGTWLTEVGVTIAGQPFKHLLIQCVLPSSNWEGGVMAPSEAWLALPRGLQSSLLKLGYVPEYHQTDHSSAAVRSVRGQTSPEPAYNQAYLELLAHFGLKPGPIRVGCPQQNGDIEARNGGLKQGLEQPLLLRGRRDFETLADYEAFLGQVMTNRNQPRPGRLQEEGAGMKPLTTSLLWPYQEGRLKVNRGSLIRVQHNLYSGPSHLIGPEVTVRIFEWHLAVYYRQIQVEWLPRRVGYHKQQINSRHLIESLLPKPGGFRDYRYREAFFPTVVFRQAWGQLNQWYSARKTDLIYLQGLRLAARSLESEGAAILNLLLDSHQGWEETDVERLLHPQLLPPPQLTRPLINLAQYDRLLKETNRDPN